MRHHTRRRFVAGVVFLVLLTGCASDAAVQTGDGLVADSVVATPTEVVPVATTGVISDTGPVPSPTALVIEQAAPTVVISAPDPTPESQESPTEVPATPDTPAPVAPALTAPAPASGAAPAATAAPASPPSTDSQQVQAANGAEVYTLNCARCHGENGLGAGQYSAGLIGVGSQYSTAGMIAELTSGHPVTFGFADRLSADEIASVVAYVKSVFP